MTKMLFRMVFLLGLGTLFLTLPTWANETTDSLTQEQHFEILYFEPLPSITLATQASSELDSSRASFSWSFEVFGRVFHVTLDPNNRLIANLPTSQRERVLSRNKLFRGKIDGVEDSWVRLTQVEDRWHGMIWDGQEIYIIDPMVVLMSLLSTPPSASTSELGIYRLSDTRDLGVQACGLGLPGVPATPIQNFQGMVRELQEGVALTAEGANLNLDMAVVADLEFVETQQNDFGTSTDAAVIARMNVVDGIFSEQIGVQLNLVEIRELGQNGPLSGTTDPSALLREFGNYTDSSAFTHPGIAALFTGRDLSGNTVGIAYLNALCSDRFGVGVNEIRGGGTARALVVAHELGHNFGAPHDNQEDSACSSTPGNFLMNPSINGSDQFSQCSIDEMQGEINFASCITLISSNRDPNATNDSYNISPNSVFWAPSFRGLLTNDSDPDGDSLTVVVPAPVTNTDHGELVLRANGAFQYIPVPGFSGTDSFVYTLQDGQGGTDQATVTLSVSPGGGSNTNPTATDDSYSISPNSVFWAPSFRGLLTNDSDPDGDSLTVVVPAPVTNTDHGELVLRANGAFQYIPVPGFSGTDSFVYTLQDGQGGTDQATVTLSVSPGGGSNTNPTATDDSYSISPNSVFWAPSFRGLLTNDSDPDGDSLTVVVPAPVINTDHGELVLRANGAFQYIPVPGFSGTDSFVYTLQDGQGGTDQATVTLTIQ